IYGLCESQGRKQLWDNIIFCSNRFKKSPWTLLGDFNVTRFSYEHSNSYRVSNAMEEFNYTIRSAELDDLKSTGLNFTWNNMRKSYAHTYNPSISDHSPHSIQLMQQVQSSGRPFKFLNFWAEHPDFLKIVRHEWAKSYEGPPLRRIQLKLKCLKCQLRKLPTRPETLTADLRQQLKKVQLELDNNPNNADLKCQEIRLRKDLTSSAKNEEAYFKQKSRLQWLKEGDSNT
ncbi:hypothetical protein CFOL_v3_32842, partial [Cephalotus follicularis]